MKRYILKSIALIPLLLVVCGCTTQSEFINSEEASIQSEQIDDQQVVEIILAIDRTEMTEANEAPNNDASQSVRLYAKYLSRQHRRNLERTLSLSKELGLEPKESPLSSKITLQGIESLKTLSELSGKAFDTAFVNITVKDHQGVIEIIDTQLLPGAKNPKLKMLVKKFRAMIEDHLKKGLRLQKSLEPVQNL